MKIAILYATTDGQTRKIARGAADHLADRGHAVELVPVADAEDLDLARFDGVILAGSLHLGGFQRALGAYAHDHAAALNAHRTLFLPVSLSAAGHNTGDWIGLTQALDEFQEATGWVPGRVEHVAGAYRPSVYDILRRAAMRRILVARDPGADPSKDKEYTDWPGLRAMLNDWTGRLVN